MMKSKVKKWLFNALGMFCLIFAIINIVIPGLPTTPLLILASMLFAVANPKMNEWLLRSKFLGPYLDNYYNKRGMAMAYKIRTSAFKWAGMIFAITMIEILWVRILVASIGVAVSTHIFLTKTKKPQEGEYGLTYNLFTILLVWAWLCLALVITVNTALGYMVVSGIGIGITTGILIFAFISDRNKM
jgi:hypothetical protein